MFLHHLPTLSPPNASTHTHITKFTKTKERESKRQATHNGRLIRKNMLSVDNNNGIAKATKADMRKHPIAHIQLSASNFLNSNSAKLSLKKKLRKE